MTVPQILFLLLALAVTAVVAWWLGRRGVWPVTAAPEVRPVGISDPESLLHERLAQAAAEMVVPLESYFSRGVELNLTTASLTKELLAEFPEHESRALLALQSGLDRVGLERLSQESGLSLSALETLRKNFLSTAANALLPKIKAGLSISAATTSEPALTLSTKPSNLTERLTLTTESDEVVRLKRLLEVARTEHAELQRTHVPKLKFDSLEDETVQQRKTQAQLSQTIDTLQSELQQARQEIAALPVDELTALRQQVQVQETLALQLSQTIGQLQSELHSVSTETRRLQALQASHQALEATLAGRQAAHEEAVAAVEATHQQQSATLSDAKTILEKQLATIQESHVPRAELVELQNAHEAAILTQVTRGEELAAAQVLQPSPAELEVQSELRSALEEAQQALTEAFREKTTLEKQLAKLQEDHETLDQTSEALTRELQDVQQTHTPRAELEEMQGELRLAQEECQRLEGELSESESRLAALAEEKAALAEAGEVLEALLNQNVEALQQAKATLAEAQQQVETARQEQSASAMTPVPRAELEALQDRSEAEQTALSAQVQALSESKAALEEHHAAALAEADALQQRIDAMESALEEHRSTAAQALEAQQALLAERESLAQQLSAAQEAPRSESQEELAVELKIARESQARMLAELETFRAAQAAIPPDQQQAAELLAELEQAAALAMEEKQALQSTLEAVKTHRQELETSLLALRQGTVPRSDYETLRLEADKARADLSTTLGRYATLLRRFEAVDKAASIERLKASLSQEEKAHGVLRIQYRNLESRLYEAVGARKRVETDLKTLAKERDEVAVKLKAAEKSAHARVKVTLPPEVANPPLEENLTEEPAPKKRASRKKAADLTVLGEDAPESASAGL